MPLFKTRTTARTTFTRAVQNTRAVCYNIAIKALGAGRLNTPFLNKIKLLSGRGGRFFVPGHKGDTAVLNMFAGLDFTEIEGADNLQNPSAELLESERNMAAVYGAGATCYSASGSSSCIMAMLSLCVQQGDTVVMARNCHVSAVRALALIDANAHFVYPQNGRIEPQAVRAALETTGAKTVYVTSPDYYGVMCDVAALAQVCAHFGAKLLVDNAHGAHLPFVKAPYAHPITLGAYATADSAHKTLPCLTPAAMLHLKNAADKPRARQFLNLYTSTSPSYPVLCSLDYMAGLAAAGAINYDETAANIATLRAICGPLALEVDDPCKLTLVPAACGFSTDEAVLQLAAHGITAEFVSKTHVVLMATAYNTPQDFENLQAACTALAKLARQNLQADVCAETDDTRGGAWQKTKASWCAQANSSCSCSNQNSQAAERAQAEIDANTPQASSCAHQNSQAAKCAETTAANSSTHKSSQTKTHPETPFTQPLCGASIRQAVFAKSSTVSVALAIGRTAASIEAPCPPGIPILIPGEIITQEIAQTLINSGILHVEVIE